MNAADARFVARVLSEFYDIEADTFRLPRRRVPEGLDAPPIRYAVMTVDGTVITSVEQARAAVAGE